MSENEIVEDVKDDVEAFVKKHEGKYVDNGWPFPDGEHAVSEFAASLPGALSPFGDTQFPLSQTELPWVNPLTIINTNS